jgi:hypothetical protein
MDIYETLIDYKGEINYNIISKILGELKVITEQLQTTVGTYKRLLSVTDETLENISMYYKKVSPENDARKDFLTGYQLSSSGLSYLITARSLLKNNDKNVLCKRIDRVNAYSRDQIKSLYKKTISNGIFSAQGGAGLGLLIIARSSENKINYTFEQINQEWTYFSLIIEISK